MLLHIFISNFNENIKLLLIKLNLERKLISHFNPAAGNITDLETKSTGYTSALWKDSFSKAVDDGVVQRICYVRKTSLKCLSWPLLPEFTPFVAPVWVFVRSLCKADQGEDVSSNQKQTFYHFFLTQSFPQFILWPCLWVVLKKPAGTCKYL